MSSIKPLYIVIGVVLVGIVLLVWFNQSSNATVTKNTEGLTAFAECIADSGATFYGAFWCPHCQEQKAMFGDAVEKLPYVECSTPDQQDQTQVCKDAGITGYPTWEFSDGSRESGVQTLQTLAARTTCELPAL